MPAPATVVAGTLVPITRQLLQLERFKSSTDSASLLVPTQKKQFQFWVWGSLGGTSQVGVFWRF